MARPAGLSKLVSTTTWAGSKTVSPTGLAPQLWGPNASNWQAGKGLGGPSLGKGESHPFCPALPEGLCPTSGPTSCPVPSHLALLMVSVLTSVQYTWSSRESQSRATALRTSASGMTSSDRSSVSKLIRRMSILRAKSRNLSRPDQRPKGVFFNALNPITVADTDAHRRSPAGHLVQPHFLGSGALCSLCFTPQTPSEHWAARAGTIRLEEPMEIDASRAQKGILFKCLSAASRLSSALTLLRVP